MLGYVMVGTNDIEKSGKFYDKLLAELGAKRNMEADSFISWSGGRRNHKLCRDQSPMMAILPRPAMAT